MTLRGKAPSVAAEPLIQPGENAWGSPLPRHLSLSVHLQLDNGISGADALRGDTRTHPEHEG